VRKGKEVRSQRSEGRGQKPEVGRQRTAATKAEMLKC